jgi:hypothetical protein
MGLCGKNITSSGTFVKGCGYGSPNPEGFWQSSYRTVDNLYVINFMDRGTDFIPG